MNGWTEGLWGGVYYDQGARGRGGQMAGLCCLPNFQEPAGEANTAHILLARNVGAEVQ